MYARPARPSSSRSSIGIDRSSWRAVRAWNSARSAYGTPSSSQITSDGIGSANACTRSAGLPAAAIASRCSSTISTIRGSSRCIRRTVNSGVSRRRSRVCSGGSNASSWPARALSRSSSLRGSLGGRNAIRLLNRVASPSTSRTSA